jgi:hypothetical protein
MASAKKHKPSAYNQNKEESDHAATQKVERISLIAEEYTAMRADSLKHQEFRVQFVYFTLTAASILLVAGLQGVLAAALIYPMIAAFLADRWANHHRMIMLIGAYIRTHIETKTTDPDSMWESYGFKTYHSAPSYLIGWDIGSIGIFVFTQMIAIFIGAYKIPRTPSSSFDFILLVLDVVALLYTLVVVTANIKQAQKAMQKAYTSQPTEKK